MGPGIASEIVGPVLRALVHDLGVPMPAAPPDGASHVPGDAADALIDGAAKAAKAPHLALDLAARIPIGGLGVLDYALCTSTTLRDALRRTARYYGVVTDRVKLLMVEDATRATLTFARDTTRTYSRHWAEFGVAMVAIRVKQTLGRHVAFEEVTFMHTAPNDLAPYTAFFGRDVTFGSDADRLVLGRELLSQPLVTAAASLAEVLEEKMRAMTPPADAPDPFLDRVQVAVGDLLASRDVSLESLATRLHLTRRTLQRELQRRGTSHKRILDDVRRERALKLLTQGNTSVTEVGFALGLTEPSSFVRACRRWTRTSPAAFRDQKDHQKT